MDLREKLLLRQIDVLNRAPDSNKINFGEISFLVNEESKVLELLREYGNYQNIDCYLPYLENENEDMGCLFEKSFYDPSSIDNKKLSESIINLTLKESQNLITKSSDLVTQVGDKLKVNPLKTVDTSMDHHGNEEKSIKHKNDVKVNRESEDDRKMKRNDVTTSSKKKTLKNISNLTLNNCNGNIVLKNVSNLTINTCKQPLKAAETLSVPTKPCQTSKSCDGSFYQCDFYERLISENEVLKRSIVKQSLCTTYPDPIATTCMSPQTSTAAGNKNDDGTYSINSNSTPDDTTTTSSIIDEAEDGLPARNEKTIVFDPTIEEVTTRTMIGDTLLNHQPGPSIQCWLNKMLLETETEAHNMTDFLEISNII